MAEVLAGKIVEWDSKRGFGFLSSGEQRIFVHIKDYSERHHLPVKGDRVAFVMGKDARGRTCAQEVKTVSRRTRLRLRDIFQLLGLLILPILALDAMATDFRIYLGYGLVISIGCWLAYREDKMNAHKGIWRIRESTLHWLSLAGGWPGGFLAQKHLSHKTAKRSFLFVFWITVLMYQLIAFDCLAQWRISKAVLTGIKLPDQQDVHRGIRSQSLHSNGIIPME